MSVVSMCLDFNISKDQQGVNDWYYRDALKACSNVSERAVLGMLNHRFLSIYQNGVLEYVRGSYDILPVMHGKKVTAYMWNNHINGTTHTIKADWGK